jgi:hypothetical protein
MSATLLYRIAAVLFVLFAAGHTAGFLLFRPPSPEGAAVLDAMNNVHFGAHGAAYTYGGFYRGFGLFVTGYMLFSAVLAWQLGAMARARGAAGAAAGEGTGDGTMASARRPAATGMLAAVGWALCTVQVADVVLGGMYFSVAQMAFPAVLALCLGGAAWRVQTGRG